MNAHYYGIAVLHRSRDGDVTLLQEGRCGPVATARPTSISRSVEELVYQAILNRGLVAEVATT